MMEGRDKNGGLLSAVMAVIAVRDPPLEVCRSAMDFPEFVTLDRTIEAITDIRTPTHWTYIRHYLVRLQSWHRKSAIVVRFAARYSAVIEGCSCEWLRLPEDAELPRKDEKTNLLGALKRMLPRDQQERAIVSCISGPLA